MNTLGGCLVVMSLLCGAFCSPAWAWQAGGSPVCTESGGQRYPAIVRDGAWGAIVAWDDTRNGDSDIFVQRLNATGVPQWTAGGVPVTAVQGDQIAPEIVSDDAGGAILVWYDGRNGPSQFDLYVQRVNASGVPQWTADGLAIRLDPDSTSAGWPEIISDDLGGAIVVWVDQRDRYTTLQAHDIYAQRVTPSGAPAWTANGVAVCTELNSQLDPGIAPDGSSGVIIAWQDDRNPLNSDIYAQRITSSGIPSWTANGIPVCGVGGPQAHPVVKRGSTLPGTIIAWEDLRFASSWDIFAQRYDLQGNHQWNLNGVAVSTAADDQRGPRIVADGFGGAVIAWEDRRNGTPDIYAQRMHSSGANVWLLDGALVSGAANAQTQPRLVSDGSGGAVITWLDRRGGTRNDIYAQRMAATGGIMWTFNGAPIATGVGEKVNPELASEAGGFGIVAWEDYRDGGADIYAQRVEFTYGQWGGPEPVLNSIVDMPLDQGSLVEIEWNASDRDVAGDPLIDHYTIWRGTDDGLGGTTWEEMGSVDANAEGVYSSEVSTLFNWPAASPAEHEFYVVAHSVEDPENPAMSWPSNVMNGHSVDNLAPPAPAFLSAVRLATGDVQLQWNHIMVPDRDHYSVYRATAPGVVPSAVSFLASSPETLVTDTDPPPSALYYIVTAHDVNGNEGPPSNEAFVDAVTRAGDVPELTALTVLGNVPNPFSTATTMRIGLPRASSVQIDVFDIAGRRVVGRAVRLGAGWREVSFDARDARGAALPSGVYFCRVIAAGESKTRKMVIAR